MDRRTAYIATPDPHESEDGDHAEHEHPGVGAHATGLQGRPQSADQPREAPTGTIHGEPINETAVDATIHHRLGEPVDRTNDHGVVDLIDIVLVIEHAA